MILHHPRVRPRPRGLLEPLARLRPVLAQPHKVHQPPRVEPAGVVDRLQERRVHAVHDVGVLFGGPPGLVERLERDHAALARQLRPDLAPEARELALEAGGVGARGPVEPLPAVVVHVDEGVQAARAVIWSSTVDTRSSQAALMV